MATETAELLVSLQLYSCLGPFSFLLIFCSVFEADKTDSLRVMATISAVSAAGYRWHTDTHESKGTETELLRAARKQDARRHSLTHPMHLVCSLETTYFSSYISLCIVLTYLLEL